MRVRCAVEPLEPRNLLSLTALGGQFAVNSITSDDQYAPATASDAAGDFVVVWARSADHSQTADIYARLYAASGVPSGAEFEVNTITGGLQSQPVVAMNDSGVFVITWTSATALGGSGSDIVARRYSSSGTALDANEFRVNNYTASTQDSPTIGIDGSGDFVVAWDSNGQDGSDYGVYDRAYSAAGTALGGDVLVNQTTTDLQADPSIDMNADGDYVIAWDGGSTTSPTLYDIYARSFLASTAALSSEFLVNDSSGFTSGYQVFPSAAIDGSGNFTIAWNSQGTDGSGYGVYARRYTAAVGPAAAIFRVNTTTIGDQTQAHIDGNVAGAFSIVWNSINQDGMGGGIYLQSYGSSGMAVGMETHVSTTTANDQERPAITLNANGDAVVVWQDSAADGSGYGIFAQRYGQPPIVTDANFDFTAPALTFAFSENVSGSISTTDLTLLNQTTGLTVSAVLSVSYNSLAQVATFALDPSQLTDGNYAATVSGSGVTDASGNALDGDNNGTPGGNYVFSFFVLAGDANHDRSVNIADLGALATSYGNSGSFSQGDFNYDGVINIADLGILATNYGNTLPA